MKKTNLYIAIVALVLIIVPTTLADNAFTLEADILIQAIPGDSAGYYEAHLTNTGDTRDNYAITLISDIPEGWMSVLCIDSICLPGSTAEVMLNPGQVSEIQPDMWPFSIPGDGEFTVLVQSINEPSLTEEITFRVVSGHQTLLIGNSDTEDQYRGYYENAIDAMGVGFNYWDRCFDGFLSTDLIYYDYIVCYTGDRTTDIFSSNEGLAIMNFLNSGGNLFITGQGIASELEQTIFLEEGLGVSFEDPYSGVLAVDGIASDPISDGLSFSIEGGDGADNQTAPAFISGVNGGIAMFNYDSGVPAGIRYEHNGYQVAFLGFGFEAIDNTDDRNLLMSRTFDWFGFVVSIDDNIIIQPEEFTIVGNYPNPFNASTTIEYNISISSFVTVDIYDMLGRKVETVFDGIAQAGNNRVVWNADNYGSGIYFSRIQSGELSAIRKLVLLK